MGKIGQFFVGWILGGKIKGLLQSLSGYTTYLGTLLSVVTIGIWTAGGMEMHDAAMKYLSVIIKAGLQEPLSIEEKQAAVNALIVLIGICGKLYKFATGKPQVPQPPKPVTLTLHKNPAHKP